MAHAIENPEVPAIYGWSGEGKTAAEIAADIRQTRYRVNADVRALKAKLRRATWPFAAAAVVGLVVRLLIRRRRR